MAAGLIGFYLDLEGAVETVAVESDTNASKGQAISFKEFQKDFTHTSLVIILMGTSHIKTN